jgi:hypothetical protein
VADAWLRRPLESFRNFFNGLPGSSNRDFAVLVGVQFLAQAGHGVVQGAIGKSIGFGGQKGFDIQNVPSADYLLKVVLWLYLPYTIISPFIGVFIDRFPRRRVMWWANLIVAAIVSVIARGVLPLGSGRRRARRPTAGLICPRGPGGRARRARVKSTRPRCCRARTCCRTRSPSRRRLDSASRSSGACYMARGRQCRRPGRRGDRRQQIPRRDGAARDHVGREASQVIHNMIAGIKQMRRGRRRLGLLVQMLRYQFWGLGCSCSRSTRDLGRVAATRPTPWPPALRPGGLVGNALGLVLAQNWKDHRSASASMTLLGADTLLFGRLVSVPTSGDAVRQVLLVLPGKITADTITQQAMPDDFRAARSPSSTSPTTWASSSRR